MKKFTTIFIAIFFVFSSLSPATGCTGDDCDQIDEEVYINLSVDEFTNQDTVPIGTDAFATDLIGQQTISGNGQGTPNITVEALGYLFQTDEYSFSGATPYGTHEHSTILFQELLAGAKTDDQCTILEVEARSDAHGAVRTEILEKEMASEAENDLSSGIHLQGVDLQFFINNYLLTEFLVVSLDGKREQSGFAETLIKGGNISP